MIQKTTLKNGLRIATMNIDSIAASVGVFVGAGAVNEKNSEYGLSHFLEHMAFKGTKKRTIDQIAEEIEFTGGSTNAYTSFTHTAYYATVLNSEVFKTAEILVDSVFNSIFPEKEIETERSVIKQEILRGQDDPFQLCFFNLHDVMYKDQPLGSNIIGTAEILDTFNKTHFENYVKKWYVPNNIIIVAAGQIDHDQFVKHIEQLTSSLTTNPIDLISDSNFKSGVITNNDKNHDQTNIIFSFEGYGKEDIKNSQAMEMLSCYLSDGMCSPLFKEVREKRGLVYYVDSNASSYNNTGYFSIMAGTTKEHVTELVNVSLGEIERVITNFEEKHLQRSKNKIKMTLGKYQESTMGMMKYIGSSWLNGDEYLKTFDEMIEIAQNIQELDIKNMAEKVLNSKRAFSIVGSIDETSLTHINNMV